MLGPALEAILEASQPSTFAALRATSRNSRLLSDQPSAQPIYMNHMNIHEYTVCTAHAFSWGPNAEDGAGAAEMAFDATDHL